SHARAEPNSSGKRSESLKVALKNNQVTARSSDGLQPSGRSCSALWNILSTFGKVKVGKYNLDLDLGLGLAQCKPVLIIVGTSLLQVFQPGFGVQIPVCSCA
ncbi:hypothetical protein EGW08_006469, partial [Elysia chlorotica]